MVGEPEAEAQAEPKSVCSVEGCEEGSVGEVAVWQHPPIDLPGDEPAAMVNIPLCAKHFDEYQANGAEAFFGHNPLKGAL